MMHVIALVSPNLFFVFFRSHRVLLSSLSGKVDFPPVVVGGCDVPFVARNYSRCSSSYFAGVSCFCGFTRPSKTSAVWLMSARRTSTHTEKNTHSHTNAPRAHNMGRLESPQPPSARAVMTLLVLCRAGRRSFASWRLVVDQVAALKQCLDQMMPAVAREQAFFSTLFGLDPAKKPQDRDAVHR